MIHILQKYTLLYTYLAFGILFSTQIFGQGFPIASCQDAENQSISFAKADALNALMKELTQSGVPGMVLGIETSQGTWVHAEGFAKLEDKTALQPCHLQYLGSIPKLYMATVIMKLWEEGKINLDSSIVHYLPKELSQQITDASAISVKMLLNHTSGINEYNDVPRYICKLLQEPKYIFDPVDYVQYVRNKKADFAAGSRYSYRNINYVLLSLIADYITGDHAAYMRKVIFEPLQMHDTFYRIEQGNTYGNRLVNSYWDRYSNAILENTSVLLNTNTASMAGDDGIVCTPADALRFLKGLISGKIVSETTLTKMQEWVKDRKGNERYGLGFTYATFANTQAIGHSGGGLGTGCQLYYFPEKELFMFMAINVGTVTDSPIFEKATPILEKIYAEIVK